VSGPGVAGRAPELATAGMTRTQAAIYNELGGRVAFSANWSAA
jgi:hypothetical protein